MARPVVNLDELEFEPRPPTFAPRGESAERYGVERADVSRRIGARKLGYNVARIPPGKRAYPRHAHRVNEELFFVLEGRGEMRIGDAVHAVRRGDFVACPPGGPEDAHQLVNTGDADLVYLALSTLESPELVHYPDSAKFGVLAALPPDEHGQPRRWAFFGREEQCLEYWDGE